MRRAPITSLSRTAALLALGALAVHQLRYIAGYGHAASTELARQGHGYLGGALPVLGSFLLSAIVAGLLRAVLIRRTHSGAEPRGRRARLSTAGSSAEAFSTRSLLFAVAIVSVFCFQESLEGMLSAGHPGGLAAVLAHGGWLALPLALLIGALCALLDRALTTLEAGVAGEALSCRRWQPSADAPRPRFPVLVPLSATPLAFGIARRPPPLPAWS